LVEQAIFQLLSESADVSAFVGTRIYPSILPQDVTYPAIAYRLAGYEGVERLEPRGVSGLARHRIRTFATVQGIGNYETAKELQDAIRLCLSGFQGTCIDGASPDDSIDVRGISIVTAYDFYEPDTETHQVIADWDVWTSETQPT
jgi:hypothetical protein